MGKIQGGTILDLDKERKFTINLNALINFEKASGKNAMEIKEGDVFSLADVRALLWAGLNEHEELTIEEAGKLIDTSNMAEVSRKIMSVYDGSMPEPKEENEDEQDGKNIKRPVG